MDCEVNAFLRLERDRSDSSKLLADPKCATLKSIAKLSEFKKAGKWITCRECARIGDVIIALEQPSSWCLVHVDGDFHHLCHALGRRHKQLPSVIAADKKAGIKHP